MKTSLTSAPQKSATNYVTIFVTSLGISYALISQIFYNKSNMELLVIMICLLSVGVTSKLKYSKVSN